MTGAVPGPDGRERCPWAVSAPDYLLYHDQEWGRPVRGDDALFERLCLEAFQSGLSWLTILRRRSGFREAFADFRIEAVAAFTEQDEARLLTDVRIIRNRAKIRAALHNARVAAALPSGLDALVWSYAPDPSGRPAPHSMAEVPATTVESVALAKALKKHGFQFVGPTTAYAAMQACGLVNDHLVNCCARQGLGA